MGVPDHFTCLLRKLHMSQEATVRTGHRTNDWLKIGKGVWQGCILSSCLFNLWFLSSESHGFGGGGLLSHCCLVAQSCLPLCNPRDCSMQDFPVLHYLSEFDQTHVSDAIQQSHLLFPPSPPDLNLSQHQGLFQWVSSLNQVSRVLIFLPKVK